VDAQNHRKHEKKKKVNNPHRRPKKTSHKTEKLRGTVQKDEKDTQKSRGSRGYGEGQFQKNRPRFTNVEEVQAAVGKGGKRSLKLGNGDA